MCSENRETDDGVMIQHVHTMWAILMIMLKRHKHGETRSSVLILPVPTPDKWAGDSLML